VPFRCLAARRGGGANLCAVKPTYFAGATEFRTWLRRNHRAAAELWVGFRKKASGQGGITYPEALDEALCFGWIDGLRKTVDAASYMIRFTPRRKDSIWSNVNIRKVKELIRGKRMQAAGLAAFEHRDAKRTGVYRYEHQLPDAKPAAIRAAQLKAFKKNAKAWAFFESQPPYYRKLCARYVTEAKREETRARRLAQLIALSALGQRLPNT
jgi:uncharacterized protein YdeI (YjbR/CyaY-like superfamily)